MSPDYEPTPIVPFGHEAGRSNNLWTPTNVEYLHSWLVGTTGEGTRAWKHEFQLHYLGEKATFGVLAEEDVSDKQIEDMAAGVSERTAKGIRERVQARGSKLRPEDLSEQKNWSARRDLAAAWREYRKWRKKQKASTTGKTLYRGLTNAQE